MCQHLLVGDVSCARIIVTFHSMTTVSMKGFVGSGSRGTVEQGHAISDDDRRRGFGGTAVEEYGGSVDRDSSFGLSCFCCCCFLLLLSGSGSPTGGDDGDDDYGERRQRQTTAVRWYSVGEGCLGVNCCC